MAGERVLLIEGDDRAGAAILCALQAERYEATWETAGRRATAAIAQQRPDVVLLDLGVSDIDGLLVCRLIHQYDPTIDVIVMSEHTTELDIVIGLDAGAIDYLAKPLKLSETLARVRAQLRRSALRQPRLVAGELAIDLRQRRCWLRGCELALRTKEFDLLARLVVDAGNVVAADVLMRDVWSAQRRGPTKTLAFHVTALRKKLDLPGLPSSITTLHGIGYRFELPRATIAQPESCFS